MTTSTFPPFASRRILIAWSSDCCRDAGASGARSSTCSYHTSLLGDGVVAAQSKAKLPLGLDPDATYILDDNPLTPQKIALGGKFFWDKRWSASGTVACVSCHPPDHGWIPRTPERHWQDRPSLHCR